MGTALVLVSKSAGLGFAPAMGLLLLGTVVVLWSYVRARRVPRSQVRVAVGFAFAFAILAWPFVIVWAVYAFGHPSET